MRMMTNEEMEEADGAKAASKAYRPLLEKITEYNYWISYAYQKNNANHSMLHKMYTIISFVK